MQFHTSLSEQLTKTWQCLLQIRGRSLFLPLGPCHTRLSLASVLVLMAGSGDTSWCQTWRCRQWLGWLLHRHPSRALKLSSKHVYIFTLPGVEPLFLEFSHQHFSRLLLYQDTSDLRRRGSWQSEFRPFSEII